MSETEFKAVELSANLAVVPGLREQIQSVIPTVAEELIASADRISLKFFLAEGSNDPRMLNMEIHDDLCGWNVLTLPPAALVRGNNYLRKTVRSAHSEILEQYMRKQVDIYKKRMAEPVEAT